MDTAAAAKVVVGAMAVAMEVAVVLLLLVRLAVVRRRLGAT